MDTGDFDLKLKRLGDNQFLILNKQNKYIVSAFENIYISTEIVNLLLKSNIKVIVVEEV